MDCGTSICVWISLRNEGQRGKGTRGQGDLMGRPRPLIRSPPIVGPDVDAMRRGGKSDAVGEIPLTTFLKYGTIVLIDSEKETGDQGKRQKAKGKR